MKRVTRNEALIFVIASLAFFWVLPFIFNPEILRWVFSSLAFGVCLAVMVQWARPTFNELLEHGPHAEAGAWVIVLGVFYWAFTLSWQRIYAMAVYWFDNPPWIQKSAFAAFVPYSIMVGGLLFLIAPSMADGPVVMPNKRAATWVGIALFVGGIAAGAAGHDVLLDLYN